MRVAKDNLKDLIQTKLKRAGLSEDHSSIVSDVLVFADAKGIHSHGAMRVEYYAERIAKKGINHAPEFQLETTGPSSAIYHADNGSGHVAAKFAMEEAIRIAKENGVAIVGVKQMSHSGALSYFTEMAAEQDLVSLSICQSDPMVVPFGGSEPYYGTNPLAFAAPGNDGEMISFDMATTVQAWGKILHARSKNEAIPDTWAVDEYGEPTTDPHKVKALLPISGPKGYGLGMMIDVLSGILLGLPFGNKVSSMYQDLSEGRDLGQLHIVINPDVFTNVQTFKDHITQTMKDLNAIKPAKGFDQVYYPGQNYEATEKDYEENGIEIVDDIYEYLVSDVVHHNAYDHQDPFADIHL